jgi:hypothetical protein
MKWRKYVAAQPSYWGFELPDDWGWNVKPSGLVGEQQFRAVGAAVDARKLMLAVLSAPTEAIEEAKA